MWKVMAADDEAYMRDALVQMIPWKDYDCQLAGVYSDGRQLIDAMEEGHPDIVITDIRMPDLDGIDVCRYVYEHCPEAQVIVLSAYSDFSYAQSAMRYSACEYVLKVDLFTGLPRALAKASQLLEKQQDDMQKDLENPSMESTTEDLYKKMTRYVEMNYRSNFTLTDMAEALHASQSYLSRLYKACHGVNLFDDILNRRIEKAKECLLAANWRVQDVAEYVGFEDAGYFAKVFKKQTGSSPKEYKHAREKKI